MNEVRQLGRDRALLVRTQGQVRIVGRDPVSEEFVFGGISIQDGSVLHLFSESEYELLQSWRGEKDLFKNQPAANIKEMWAWLEYLLGQNNEEPSHPAKPVIENLLLAKVASLRPHLPHSLHPPNPILLHCEDAEPYKEALQYFPQDGRSSLPNSS